MKCPNCGVDAKGRFCPECGTPLETVRCAACQAKLETGARFCTQCGARAGGSLSANAPWYVAGAAILALILVLLLPDLQKQPAPSMAPPFAGGNAGTPTPPPLSDNMRENADRLFNRVMEARENGDSAGVKQFAPMAVMAYENSGPLDDDGLYHLSLLQAAAGNPRAALETARRVLQGNPNHLLALAAAANAALSTNDASAARGFYEQIVRAYPTEQSRQLPEYLDHARVLPQIEAEAKEFLKR
jgi:hypothetical protein